MAKCSIFLSKKENYLDAAIKIKKGTRLTVNIVWIEDFILMNDKYNYLENNIIYFLCNSPLIKKVIDLLENVNCYIFNEEFFKNNYTKLEIQKILIGNKITTPKIFNDINDKEIKFPIFCKENVHAGIIFKAYTINTIIRFFEKFNKEDFYIEEAVEGQDEVKYYYIKGNIYAKNNVKIDNIVKEECIKISKKLNLDVFSLDIIKNNEINIIIDVNPSAGFYLLDEARNKLIYEIEKVEI